MDKTQGWASAAAGAKSSVINTLDALSPAFAPMAARWDAAADRRAKLRTPEHLKALMDAQRAHNSARSTAATAQSQRAAARKGSKNPFGAARRAAATADRAARQHKSEAKTALQAARRDYPATLNTLAVRAHALHVVPSSLASWALSTSADWATWPVSVSAGLIALNVGGLWLGRRKLSVQLDDGLSLEERQLVGRLDPSYWVGHAADRGLSGTVTTPPEVTSGGIRCSIRLDGAWTVKALKDKTDNIRNLLGARTALRIRITSGKRGGWAVISLATRQATDGTSSLWTPDMLPANPALMCIGLDTETGELVFMPFDERVLISGASGTGKSWSVRALLATALLRGDLLFIDGKGEEANVWEHVCRVAVEADEIAAAIDEAHAEMGRRKADMKRRGISVWDGRQLTVMVDEGQVVLAAIAKDKDRLQRLVELSSLGRSRGVVLWWATQYPVTDGLPGVHKLIAPNLLTRFSLRVAGTTQAQVALDDCAHYAPHQIPDGKQWRGHGYLKGYGPRLIRTWTLDDDGVKALPPRFWKSSAPAAPVVVEPAEDTPAPVTNRDRVLTAVRDGARTPKDVTETTGLNKGTVSRELTALVKTGLVLKTDGGALEVAA